MAQQTDISKMETTQTAVEWLFETMAKTPMTNWYEIREQAKAMEKEQIMKAVNRGYDEGCKFPGDMTLKNAEQYYNDTYTQGSK